MKRFYSKVKKFIKIKKIILYFIYYLLNIINEKLKIKLNIVGIKNLLIINLIN